MSMRRFEVLGLLPRLALLLLLAVAVTAAAIHRDEINLATLDARLLALGPWGPIAYIVLYALSALAFIPGMVFALAGGALFGPLWGSLWNLLGATLGAVLAFLTARYLAGGWITRKAGGPLKRLMDGVDAEGWRFVAFVRLVPLFPFNLSNYLLGLTRIPLLQYAIATLVCMAPGAIAYTWLGHAGREALAGEMDAIRYGLLALGLLAAVALLPRLIGRLRRPFKWIETGDLKRRLEAGDAITVIDVRGPDEFTGPLGHIEAALNLPVGEIPNRLSEINTLKNRPVILVCRTDRRSATAAALLGDAGFQDVHVLRGGMELWSKSGLSVEGWTAAGATSTEHDAGPIPRATELLRGA